MLLSLNTWIFWWSCKVKLTILRSRNTIWAKWTRHIYAIQYDFAFESKDIAKINAGLGAFNIELSVFRRVNANPLYNTRDCSTTAHNLKIDLIFPDFFQFQVCVIIEWPSVIFSVTWPHVVLLLLYIPMWCYAVIIQRCLHCPV